MHYNIHINARAPLATRKRADKRTQWQCWPRGRTSTTRRDVKTRSSHERLCAGGGDLAHLQEDRLEGSLPQIHTPAQHPLTDALPGLRHHGCVRASIQLHARKGAERVAAGAVRGAAGWGQHICTNEWVTNTAPNLACHHGLNTRSKYITSAEKCRASQLHAFWGNRQGLLFEARQVQKGTGSMKKKAEIADPAATMSQRQIHNAQLFRTAQGEVRGDKPSVRIRCLNV